jgi:DNA-binding transcriptional LysR family regulator
MKSQRKPKKALLRHLRLSQLELLAAMDRSETLSAAAREVNLTQPAASRLLRTLASDLNVDLFERVGRTLKPTTAGRALVRKAASLLADLDRTQQELEAIDGGLIGTTSIGAGVSSCYVMVPRALSLLMKAAPRIFVTVREGPMDELLTKLREGQIDLLVGRFHNEMHNPDILTQELYQPNVRVVCGPNHPLAKKQSPSWVELMRQPWILSENGTPMRSALEALFRKQRCRPEHCYVESSSIQANVALMNASNLIWVLSADVAEYFSNLRALRVLNVPEITAPGAFVIAHLRDRSLSPAAERLRYCLVRASRK